MIRFSDTFDKLTRNIKVIRQALDELELSLPIANNLKSHTKQIAEKKATELRKEKESQSVLDTLLGDAFDHNSATPTGIESEIAELRAQLLQRPTAEAYQKLLEENKKLLAARSNNPSLNDDFDRENIISIFSYLKLPNLPIPMETNLSQYLSALKSILDRSSGMADLRQE